MTGLKRHRSDQMELDQNTFIIITFTSKCQFRSCWSLSVTAERGEHEMKQKIQILFMNQQRQNRIQQNFRFC